MLNDLDFGLAYQGSQNVNEDYFKVLKKSTSITADLFNCLIKNEDFKILFRANAQVMIEHLDGKEEIFDLLKSELQNDIEAHTNRWRHNFSPEEWENNCNLNKEFLLNRAPIFIKQVQNL